MLTCSQHNRVILAFERLTPLQVCELFSRGIRRPVRYVHGPVKVEVNIPKGYREHLAVLEQTLGRQRAPYFGPQYEYPGEAHSLWTGYRGIEEYAREVFPLEEAANGLTWMEDGDGGEDAESDVAEGEDEYAGHASGIQGKQSLLPMRSLHPETDFVGSC